MGDKRAVKRAMKRAVPDMALSNKKSCPFIGNSFSECYCNSMNSLQAEDALYYCGRNYMICPIYENKTHLMIKAKYGKGAKK